MALTQGQKIRSYTLLNAIGDPNMGQVWVASSDSGESVALKCISEEFRGNQDMIRRFWRECAFQMRLRHPNIVPVLDAVQQDGDLFLVMQYIRRGSLEDRLLRLQGRPLPLEEAIRISVDILSALDYAHQQGVVHRDVKPSNILLEEGRAYLTDFGVAKGLRARPQTTAESAGTYPYMSPEQILADRPADQRSDVYGYGCVLYEMLTGRPPFPTDPSAPCSDQDLKHMHVHVDPVSPRQLNPEISDRLNRVVLTALAKNPEHRFPGCGSFALAIQGAAPLNTTGPVLALQPRPAQRVSLPAYFGSLAVVWAISLLFVSQARRQQDLIPVGVLAFIGAATVLLHMLYAAWNAIQDDASDTEPGHAVQWLFAPLFNLYWMWRAFPRFASAYNAFAERHRIEVRRENPAVYAVFVALAWAALAAAASRNAAVFAALMLVQFFVMVPVVVFFLGAAVNRLAAASIGQCSMKGSAQ
jgi:serine/threonine-protein kinase